LRITYLPTLKKKPEQKLNWFKGALHSLKSLEKMNSFTNPEAENHREAVKIPSFRICILNIRGTAKCIISVKRVLF